MRRFTRIFAASLAATALACGGGDETESLVAPMKAEVAETSAENRPPVIKSVRLEPASPIAGDWVNAQVIVEDPDGDPIELGYTWRVAGRSFPGGDSSIQLGTVPKRSRVEVSVTASDGRSTSDATRAEATVPNQRPILLGIQLQPHPEVQIGDTLVATALARDPDQDPIEYRYRWQVNDEWDSSETDRIETAELRKGDEIRVYAIANDGTADSDELASVVVQVGNSHPEITSAPEVKWTDGEFRYQVEARDPDGDRPLRYSLRKGPEGMVVDSVLGSVTWKARSDQTGDHPIEIAVSDPMGATAVQHFEITVKWNEEEAPAAPANAGSGSR